MDQFIAISLSYPTVFYSVTLIAVCFYWLLVIVGALDLDLFTGGLDSVGEGAEGAFEGIGEGAEGIFEGAEGAFEGADGVFEGAADGADGFLEGIGDGVGEGIEGVAESGLDGLEGALEGADGGADGLVEGSLLSASGLFTALGVRRVPLTVILTLMVLSGWLFSYYLWYMLGTLELTGNATLLAGMGTLFTAFMLSLPTTMLVTHPLKSVFKKEKKHHHRDVLGQMVTVKSSRVDTRFGQGEFDDGGAGLLLNIYCKTQNTLTKGDKAIVVNYNAETHHFEVAPYLENHASTNIINDVIEPTQHAGNLQQESINE